MPYSRLLSGYTIYKKGYGGTLGYATVNKKLYTDWIFTTVLADLCGKYRIT